jgi:hypothetical protein
MCPTSNGTPGMIACPHRQHGIGLPRMSCDFVCMRMVRALR